MNDRDLTLLEEELRRLPPPSVPPGLKQRLLADISPGRPSRPSSRRWALVAGALAAGLLLSVLRPGPDVPRPTDSRRPAVVPFEGLRRGAEEGPALAGAVFTWPVPPGPTTRLGTRLDPDQIH